MRSRNPDLEARWRERVDAWRSSGPTAAQFAAQNGFSTSALTGWSSKLRHRPAPRPRAPAFVAVVRKDAAPVRELVVEVAVARVRVTPGFDPALLTAVLCALGRRSCAPTPRCPLSRSTPCRRARASTALPAFVPPPHHPPTPCDLPATAVRGSLSRLWFPPEPLCFPCSFSGAPERTRTSNLQIRSLMLYPIELRARWGGDLCNAPPPVSTIFEQLFSTPRRRAVQCPVCCSSFEPNAPSSMRIGHETIRFMRPKIAALDRSSNHVNTTGVASSVSNSASV
jgi:hypothetical protein